MVVGDKKEYNLSSVAKLKKLDEQELRAKETRAALVRTIKEEIEAAEKAQKEAEIAKQVKADNKALEKKSRTLPEVGENDLDRLLKEDHLVEEVSVDSRLKKLEEIVKKFIHFKNVTHTDLIACITDIRTEANAKLSQQFVTSDIFNTKIAEVEGDLRDHINSLKEKKRLERCTAPPSPLAGSASRKRSRD